MNIPLPTIVPMNTYTIRPQRQVVMLDNAEPEVIFEECSEEEATVWAVFGEDGHICDCPSRMRAEQVERFMTAGREAVFLSHQKVVG